MKKTHIQLILAAFLLIRCEKQKDNQQDFLVINDKNNYTILRFDTLLQGGYYDEKILKIDLDNDGITDFKIYTNIWGSPGLGTHPEILLMCLNTNAFIATTEHTDTSFLYKEYDTIGYDVYIKWIFNCKKINPDATISCILKNSDANYFYQNDTLQSNFWSNDTIKLSSRSDSYPPLDDAQKGDTTIWESTQSSYDCHMVPQNSTIYLAVKTVHEKNTYLGWIKVNILNNSTIYVFETATLKIGN